MVKVTELQSTVASVPNDTTWRVLNCSPPPHVFEHEESEDHSENVHSDDVVGALVGSVGAEGHGALAHGSASSMVNPCSAHVLPLFAAAMCTVRVRVVMPKPHVVEHAAQFDQGVGTQSMGHANTLQLCTSVCVPHGAPVPCAARTTWRVRICAPPLHVAEQNVHEPQAPISQSTSQSTALQSLCSRRSPQTAEDGFDMTVRMRVVDPEPHVRVHALHAPHSLMRHGSKHTASLQLSLRVRASQSLPPFWAA